MEKLLQAFKKINFVRKKKNPGQKTWVFNSLAGLMN